MATSETFHVALRVEPTTLRLSKGCIDEVNTTVAAQLRWSSAIPDVPLSYQGPLSVFSAPSWGSVPVCLSLGAPFSFFVAPALFLLSRRASLLGQEDFFTVDILLCFGEDFGLACLRVL